MLFSSGACHTLSGVCPVAVPYAVSVLAVWCVRQHSMISELMPAAESGTWQTDICIIWT